MPTLPDLLVPGLKLVVCGTAAGTESARKQAYYAGPGNKFWRTLHRIGATPHLLLPTDYPTLPTYGIGLTDIAKHAFGADSDLKPGDFDAAALRARILAFQPKVLAFNGKKAAQAYFGGQVSFGYQEGRDAGMTKLFVAPSTSGAANGDWNEAVWHTLAALAWPDRPRPT